MDTFFDDFRSWPQYELFLEALLLEYANIASKSYLGETVESRPIPVITLSVDEELDSNKPGLYIQAAVHSNEWLSNAATAYILKAICDGYDNNDNDITYLLDNINIFIVPTVNIDGYIYSWTDGTKRNWKKNRRSNGDGSFGVDLNRNYGPYNIWNRCNIESSNIYCGTSPFSEPETKAISQFIFNPTYNIQATVDMHATGPYISWPWGYTVEALPASYYDEYVELGANMAAAANAVDGQNYVSIQSATWYEASGGMEDFVCSVSEQQVLAFRFGGRSIDSGPSQIIPAGQEQLAALVYLAKTLII